MNRNDAEDMQIAQLRDSADMVSKTTSEGIEVETKRVETIEERHARWARETEAGTAEALAFANRNPKDDIPPGYELEPADGGYWKWRTLVDGNAGIWNMGYATRQLALDRISACSTSRNDVKA